MTHSPAEGSGAGDRIADPWGPATPYGPGAAWPVRVDTFLDDGVAPEQVDHHAAEPDVYQLSHTFAGQCERHAERLQPFADRYGEDAPSEPDRLHSELFGGTRTGGLGLLRDLQDLYLMATECDIAWTMVGQAAQGARDTDLVEVVKACDGETATQLKWLKTRMKQAAPQALVVAN